MRQLTQEQLRSAIEQLGGRIPLIDGIRVPSFNALELATAIEAQVALVQNGLAPKILLHMDLQDAMHLASSLRKMPNRVA